MTQTTTLSLHTHRTNRAGFTANRPDEPVQTPPKNMAHVHSRLAPSLTFWNSCPQAGRPQVDNQHCGLPPSDTDCNTAQAGHTSGISPAGRFHVHTVRCSLSAPRSQPNPRFRLHIILAVTHRSMHAAITATLSLSLSLCVDCCKSYAMVTHLLLAENHQEKKK